MKKLPKWVLSAEGIAASMLLRFLHATIRYEVKNQPPDDLPCIYMLWHRNLLLHALQRMGSPIYVVISASQDGELLAAPLRRLGFGIVRGSSSRKGSAAYRDLLRKAGKNQLGITPDGPRGPSKTIHPGVSHVAFIAGIPIVPVIAEADKEWIFNSWDRFRCPKPFAKIRVIYDHPILLSTKEDLLTADNLLQTRMQELERQLLTNQ